MNTYAPAMQYMNDAHAALGSAFLAVVILIVALELLLTGLALWYSARNRQYVWFIIFVVVHSLGILELIYLVFFRQNKNYETHVTVSPVGTPGSTTSSAS